MELLNEFKEKAIRAHNWTSFHPEARGERMILEYNEELTSDIEELKSQNVSEEYILDYQNRYKKFFSSYLSAKSNCFSVMITGGSNFPVRRHEKANRSEHKHYEIFREWRIRAKKAIIRKSQPEKTFTSEIERYKLELESMKKNHELMKEGNKRIKQALKDMINIDDYLISTFNIQPHMLEWTMRWGFGLTNNNANMKRVEERIQLLEKKEQIKTEVGNKETQFVGFVVIENIEVDRLQIKHEAKPTQDVISLLKKNGFKWSPSQGVWQRQLTQNAIWSFNHYVLPNLNK